VYSFASQIDVEAETINFGFQPVSCWIFKQDNGTKAMIRRTAVKQFT